MKTKARLKIYMSLLVFVLIWLVGYKIYINVAYADFESLNSANIDLITDELATKTDVNFAVVGSVNNSIRIFEKNVAPVLKEKQVDFFISTGDAVFDGAEAKYQLLFKSMNRVGIPFLLSTGDHELEDFGASNYYHYFGPYLYSFPLKDQYFIMLDTTGFTSWSTVKQWLTQQLKFSSTYKNRYVFMSVSPLSVDDTAMIGPEKLAELQSLFSQYKVNIVFSLSDQGYSQQEVNSVIYVEVGQAGGLLPEELDNYQFALINVLDEGIKLSGIDIPHTSTKFLYRIENLKLFLYSVFYMSAFNVLVISTLLGLVILNLYSKIIDQESLYRDFSNPTGSEKNAALTVAMFSNNFLPFVGGVPISINRLRIGLERLGDKVTIFSPTYDSSLVTLPDNDVVRVPTLAYARKENFPIANIFSSMIRRAFVREPFDVVHIHHPYLLGRVGLKLAKKAKTPVVFTYHTRMERYTHYLPIPGKNIKSLFVHFLIRRFANQCDAVITPTVSTEEYLRNLGVSSIIETIPTGIDIDAYSGIDPDDIAKLRQQYVSGSEKLLISVSRLALEKNIFFLLDGIKKAKEKSSTPFKLLLIGSGPEQQELEEYAKSIGLESTVIFAGSMTQETVIRCYLAADLFVFASTSETQGMVLLEAMAGGCPVVAVRASGVHDVLENGLNGFKVGESIDEWSATVVRLLNDAELLTSLSENSREFSTKYSVNNMANDIERLYRRVIFRRNAMSKQ